MTTKAERLYNAKSAIIAATAGKGRNMADVPFEGIAAEIAAIETGVDTSDANATASDILATKSGYVNGVKISGTMPDNGTVSTDISAKATEVAIAAGKHSGTGVVKIAAAEQAKIIPENIKEGVSILGQVGTLPAGPGTGTYLVRWIDYDGTILKQQRVNSGVNATDPANPSHQYLTFSGWNNSNLNITRDTDIGAIYTTANGKSYLFITVSTNTGLSPMLYLNKATTDVLTVDWGNGTTSTSSAIGNINFTKAYPTAGNYIITIDCAAGYGFGNGSSVTIAFSLSHILIAVYFGLNCTSIQDYAFRQQYSLKTVVITSSITSINSQAFNQCRNLVAAIIPSSITSIAGNAFNACYSLKYVVIANSPISFPNNSFAQCFTIESIIIPPLVTSLGFGLFNVCYSIKSIILHNGITAIADGVFAGCTALFEVVILATTPPSLGSTIVFSGTPLLMKIYVPDASVTAYKTATNWISYANYIYPLSTRP